MNIEYIDDDRFYICDFRDNSLGGSFPWGNEAFDIILLVNDASLVSDALVHSVIEQLVLQDTGWFQVLGTGSETLHDVIDLTSVRLGRQKAIGDGSPMTSWDDDITTYEKMSEYAHNCLGGNNNKLVVILGDDHDFIKFIEEFKIVK
jgi:hypothetical protein